MSTTLAVAPARSAVAPADRASNIATMLGRLSEMSGEALRAAVADLSRFVRVLDVLTESDAEWQRAFRSEVIKALHRLPVAHNGEVPLKNGLRHLHRVIHQHGPGEMLHAIVVAPTPPSWLDLLRVHDPDYRAPSAASAAARESIRRSAAARLAHRKTLQRTVAELRTEVADLRGDAAPAPLGPRPLRPRGDPRRSPAAALPRIASNR